MDCEKLVNHLSKVFNNNCNCVVSFAWLIQFSFGVDFKNFVKDFLFNVFKINDWQNSSEVFFCGLYEKIKVDNAREINYFLQNNSENWRIVILFEADRMSLATSNALLKIIEDPPNRTIFLFSSIFELEQTLMSRLDVFFLSFRRFGVNNCDKIMQIANYSELVAEKICEFGGLYFVKLVKQMLYENNNQLAVLEIFERIDWQKNFDILCYLIVYFMSEGVRNISDSVHRKHIFYSYEKTLNFIAEIEQNNCSKKAFLLSFLK